MQATEVTAAKGVMMVHHTQTAEITYVVHNAATDVRTVVIEQPIRRALNWTTPRQRQQGPQAGGDHSDPLYRFRVTAAAVRPERLHVRNTTKSTASYQLTNFNDNQLTFILNQTGNNAAISRRWNRFWMRGGMLRICRRPWTR